MIDETATPAPTREDGPREDGPTLTRPRRGRWLAGVCLALAASSQRRVAVVRAGFCAATAIAGLGLIAYLVCWAIIPAESTPRHRGIAAVSGGLTTLVVALGAAVALATLALASAIAVVFGLGWGVLVVAAAVLLTGVIWLHDSRPELVLLPVAALVLPAGAVLALHLRLPRALGNIVVTPTSPAPVRGQHVADAAGTLLVDLRRYPFTSHGRTVTLHIDAGLGHTIVALPTDRCVSVRVHYIAHEGLLHQAAVALGAGTYGPAVSVYGQARGAGSGSVGAAVAPDRPTVSIDYRSEGGSLDVRDYPESIDPRSWSDWPGDAIFPARPTRAGLTRAQYRALLASWRSTQSVNRRIARLARNPCDRA